MRRIAALVSSLFLVFLVAPASAHTVLVNSSPQKDSVIQSLPSSITITFAEDLVAIGNSNSILVLDESNQDISQGDVLVTGPTLSKNLITSDKTGKFKVQYRAVSADGHVIKDEFEFTVAAAAPTPSVTSEATVNAPTNSSEHNLSIYLILSVTAVVGGLLILIFIWKKQVK